MQIITTKIHEDAYKRLDKDVDDFFSLIINHPFYQHVHDEQSFDPERLLQISTKVKNKLAANYIEEEETNFYEKVKRLPSMNDEEKVSPTPLKRKSYIKPLIFGDDDN